MIACFGLFPPAFASVDLARQNARGAAKHQGLAQKTFVKDQ
jgi:hypothetical protein